MHTMQAWPLPATEACIMLHNPSIPILQWTMDTVDKTEPYKETIFSKSPRSVLAEREITKAQL